MKRLAILTALLAFSVAAQATPETYVIDNNHTTSQFSFTTLGLSSQTHRFDKISGKVVFDPAAKTGSAEVTIDATSVNTGHALFNKQIQAADFSIPPTILGSSSGPAKCRLTATSPSCQANSRSKA